MARFLQLLLIIALILTASDASAQNNLRVLDPQQGWWWGWEQGTIEEAVVSVRPKGIFVEYGVYLTLSARGTRFSGGTPLEIAYEFTLPEKAIVTDSWLWVEDEIVRAEIMDVWTASQIYEDIVDRQQDPSILFKRGNGRYELRVYPLDARKVKLTFLMPGTWIGESVVASLPVEMLRVSKHPIGDLRVLSWPGDEWRDPVLRGSGNVSFNTGEDEDGERYDFVSLPASSLEGSLSIAYPSPLTDGVYISHHNIGSGEGWYQLAMRSEDMPQDPKKVLFLIDFDQERTTITPAEMLGALREIAVPAFAETDSFNVMVSRLAIEPVSETWLSAKESTLEAVFGEVASRISGYSNLPALLQAGLLYAGDDTSSVQIVLISSSGQPGAATPSNNLLRDLRELLPALPMVHVLDLDNITYEWHLIGNRYFRGNEYFYTNLTRSTGGTYAHVREDQSITRAIQSIVSAISDMQGSIDLHTTLGNGFCYGRYPLTEGKTGAISSSAVMLQVGKCYGQFPFVAELSGLVGETPMMTSAIVEAERIAESDTTLPVFWSGMKILEMERAAQTNAQIISIIDESLAMRVLSLHTAFLALEPSMGGEVCANCRDESNEGTTDIEDEEVVSKEAELVVYPNPFQTDVRIKLTLPAAVDARLVRFEIYDVLGRRVATLDHGLSGIADVFELEWDGTDNAGSKLASGSYLLVVTTPTGRYTTMLVLVR
jgi:hypothetical protein